MKRILLSALVCLMSAIPALSQTTSGPFLLNSTTGPTSCATVNVNPNVSSTVAINVGPTTFSGTLQPQVIIAGQTPANTTTTPEGSITSQNTITANGVYNSGVSGKNKFQVCFTDYTSGTATIYINVSSGVNTSMLNGGGGKGTVVGPGSAVVGDIAVWNCADGSCIADSGVAFPLPISTAYLTSIGTTVNGVVCNLGSTCSPGASPTGSASGDLGGTYPGPTVTGLKAVPFCTGFTPTNLQFLQYTTASSPNPCYTAALGTGFANPMTTLGDLIYGGASGTATRVAGPTTPNGLPYVLTNIPSAGAAAAPVWSAPGIGGRSVTGTTDTILTADCSPQRVAYTGSSAVAVTLPTPTTLGDANCTFKLANNTTNTVTITPTTWTISAGSNASGGSSSLVLQSGQEAVVFIDPAHGTNWAADVVDQALTAGANITITPGATGPSAALSAVVQQANGACSAGNVPYSFTNATGSGLYYTGTSSVPAMCTNGGATVAFTAGAQVTSTGIYKWANGGTITGVADLGLSRGAAGLLDLGTGAAASTAGFIKTAQSLAVVTADFTCGTGGTSSPCTTLQIITGLGVTLPSLAANWEFECDLIVSQATAAAADQIGVITATNGATNIAASAIAYTAAGTSTSAAITGVASTTTAQSIITFTPGATNTKLPIHIAGTIEGASASGTTLSLTVLTGAAADLLTIYRGSKCWVH